MNELKLKRVGTQCVRLDEPKERRRPAPESPRANQQTRQSRVFCSLIRALKVGNVSDYATNIFPAVFRILSREPAMKDLTGLSINPGDCASQRKGKSRTEQPKIYCLVYTQRRTF